VSAAFAPVDDLFIETVDSVCGSSKTLTAIAVALDRARTGGVKTLIAMPTLQLIGEMSERARHQTAAPSVPVHVITSDVEDPKQKRAPTVLALAAHMVRAAKGGELVFITHETLHRMGADWPDEATNYELIIDEAPETILSRAPFRLYDNWRALTSFLELDEPITDSPGLRRARKRAKETGYAAAIMIITPRELKLWQTFERILEGGPERSSEGEYRQAQQRVEALRAKARSDEGGGAGGGRLHAKTLLRVDGTVTQTIAAPGQPAAGRRRLQNAESGALLAAAGLSDVHRMGGLGAAAVGQERRP
jgi:hypothetical protein